MFPPCGSSNNEKFGSAILKARYQQSQLALRIQKKNFCMWFAKSLFRRCALRRAVSWTLIILLLFYCFHQALIWGEDAIGEGEKRLLVVVAQGRSGSTVLTHALTAFPNTFLISEPFRNWDPSLGLPAPRVPVPPYSILFDCSFLSDAALTALVRVCGGGQASELDKTTYI